MPFNGSDTVYVKNVPKNKKVQVGTFFNFYFGNNIVTVEKKNFYEFYFPLKI